MLRSQIRKRFRCPYLSKSLIELLRAIEAPVRRLVRLSAFSLAPRIGSVLIREKKRGGCKFKLYSVHIDHFQREPAARDLAAVIDFVRDTPGQEALGIGYQDVVTVLEDEGVAKFAASWQEMLETISTELAAAGRA